MSALELTIFVLIWVVVIYTFNSLLARKPLRINPKTAFVYITTMAALGVGGEVILDTTYNTIFGRPLWEYHILPIHNAYTSVYSLFLWGTVGFHVYLFHSVLYKKGIRSLPKLAGIFCIEAIILEALANLSFLAAFGGYIYYYNPPDLWHITSVQVFPLYLFVGFITVAVFRLANRAPFQAVLGTLAFTLSFVLIGWLNVT